MNLAFLVQKINVIVGFNLVPEVIHITCNMGSQDLPNMYAISPQDSGIHISGKSLLPMLQPIYMLHESDFKQPGVWLA